ncbi:hydroxymethylglutaryl-CoA lyase [Vibrio sinaloensis]|uniref:hydroxymethylglutaryl-CoA lyase n=1 Tax=Photobacterium sp. (strain ATCC 43367) TaxID=379097 RepID=A0A0A5HR83_PHOS4|nr:hydroxymethylglutaryl-CoA lyase [Vibrio sinaloensis]KGY06855.1 hydroxymethylglutaryl-CoA lyase [Vibrio sinaloensis]KIE21329.1 hydroxymethylglutaryl-CoA lyase [Vibrio sinaloensis]
MAHLSLPKRVKIVEVGPRDGLQNEASIPTHAKVALINQLSSSGLTHIEVGSFVSPKWVPQMADSDEVFKQITRNPDVIYAALTPNMTGFEAAMRAQADQVAVFASCSESFSQKNINCSIQESLDRFKPVIEKASQQGVAVRGYLSCIIDCPYEGKIQPEQVADIAQQLISMGCYEISLGDTIGTGTPLKVAQMLNAVMRRVDQSKLAVHFHNTWGQALANIYQALQIGVNVIDSSVAGLGGCPYAKGASGNVATEDVLYLCEGLGIDTGVDLRKVALSGWRVTQYLNRVPNSNVALALQDHIKR